MIWPAVWAVARAELRHRRASLAVVAVVAGLTGALAVGGASLARRTATAYDRLERATNADHLRGMLLGRDQVETLRMGEDLASQPGVEAARTAQMGVARVLRDEVSYLSVQSGPAGPGDPLRPVVVSGRAVAPGATDEAVVSEPAARAFGLALGDRFDLRFLTRDELYRFSARTPLEGEGPRLAVTVVGMVRMPGADLATPPLFAGPAMAARHPDAFQAGATFLARVRDRATLGRLEERGARLAVGARLPPEAGEFVAVDLVRTEVAARTAHTTTRVLVIGLAVFTGLAALAGLVALAQAMVRHQSLSRPDQQVEAALGLSRRDRVAARLLAMAPAVVAAAAVTAAGGVVAGAMEPLGGVRFLEPHPGSRVNLAVVAAGVVAAVLATAGLAAVSALRAPAPGSRAGVRLREAGVARRLAAAGGRPPVVVGLRFAFERGAGPSAVPVVSSVAAVLVGVAGVVSVLVFSAGLDRLVTTPLRFGHPAQLEVVDADDDVVDELVADDRISTVIAGSTVFTEIDGRRVGAIGQEARKGTLEWEVVAGRPPATPDEVLLGTRLADDLGRRVGDTVTAIDAGGGERQLAVVGVGVPSTFESFSLGENAAFSPEGLARFARSTPFPAASVSAAAGVSPATLEADLARRFEVNAASLPEEVKNLDDLGALPLALGVFLGALALVALGHAVLVASRRRAHDVAMLRALGFTPGQAATTLVVMAAATATAGVLGGVPIGVIGGVTVWRAVAEGAGVAGDALIQPGPVALVVVVTVALALVLALGPSRRAGRRPPALTLRAE